MREVLEVEDLAALQAATFTAPVRLAFPSPGRGGPRVSDIRLVFTAARNLGLTLHGKLRLSGTALRTFVDLDPGQPEPPVVALDTIVRNDAAGLERMLLSVLPHVDEIVLGVDARSDDETLKVAQAYADCVFIFGAGDIGLTTTEWSPSATNPRGKIDFAAARNLGRKRVHSPWTLVVDSDEYLDCPIDLRQLLRSAAPTQGTFAPRVALLRGKNQDFAQRDFQRLARTKYRWKDASHNQLVCVDCEPPTDIDVTIFMDTSLRDVTEQSRRRAQRDAGMDDCVEAAARGDLNALFHLAKHRTNGPDLQEAVRLAEDFRLRCEPNSVLSHQRQWIALGIAYRFWNEDVMVEANRWACRALLDGPSIPAFCLLGNIAECEGDLRRARDWYEAACAVTDREEIAWPGLAELRWGRLAGIRKALEDPDGAPTMVFESETLDTAPAATEPDSSPDTAAS